MLPHDCYALMHMVHAGAHSHLFVCACVCVYSSCNCPSISSIQASYYLLGKGLLNNIV